MTLNWLIYRLLLFWVLFAGSVLVPSTTWGYDGQIRQSIGYDEVLFSVFGYESSVAHTNHEKENRTLTTGGAVAYFAGFLAAKEGTTLFRVVGPEELSGIQQVGRYTGSPGGLEVKYFYPTAEQAANFAARPGNAQFGPFTLTSTEVPTSVLNSGTALNVATEGRVITIPNGQLPGLGTPTIHPSIPLPSLH
jgi:hypothetical protein